MTEVLVLIFIHEENNYIAVLSKRRVNHERHGDEIRISDISEMYTMLFLLKSSLINRILPYYAK